MSFTHGDIIFGTDGFRGAFTDEQGITALNHETIYKLSLAFLRYIEKTSEVRTVVIGRDPRASGYTLSLAAKKAAHAAGFAALDIDVTPTPATFKIAVRNQCAAIMITASHNPHTDNGWKAAINGDKLTGEQAAAVSQLYWELIDETVPSDSAISATPAPELGQWYVETVVSDIETLFGKKPLADKTYIFDGANGATAHVTPAVLRGLGATVHTYATDQTALINDGCGAAHLEGVMAFLSANPVIANDPAFVGALSADGDGDRIMMVGVDADGSAVEVDGNYSLYVMGQGEPGIVGTIYTNTAVKNALEAHSIGFDFCPNGDTAVTAALLTRQQKGDEWTKGGEATGHLVDTTWLSSGDGVRTGAWLACWAVRANKTFYDISQLIELWPQVKATVRFGSSALYDQNKDQIATEVARINEVLGKQGRVIVRKSGTEPLVRIWGEALAGPHDIKEIILDLTSFVNARS